ncbi:MAG TPA: Hint domain-containing protein [Actinomycetota bacterium]
MKRIALVALLALVAGACTYRPQRTEPSASPSPSASPQASGGVITDEWDARLALDERFDIFFCDPDDYPVGVGPQERRERGLAWYRIAERSREAAAIRASLGYREPLTDDQTMRIYEVHKRIRVIALTSSDAAWRFTVNEGTEGDATAIDGTIARNGSIHVATQRPVDAFCPICLAAGTLIATPSGDRDVTTLRSGDLVWTMDARGRRVAAPVLRTVRRPVGSPHPMLRLTLSDGRVLVAASAHPDARGRPIGALAAGDPMDGATVEGIDVVWREASATYDLLPDGPTGAYWANGILLGSTITR